MTSQVEPEWDDATRLLAEGLAEMERDSCPGCGFHSSILAEPDEHRHAFEHHVCEMCKAQAVYGRWVAAQDAKALESLKHAPPIVPRPTDGRRIRLRPLTETEKTKNDGRGGVSGGSPRQRHS